MQSNSRISYSPYVKSADTTRKVMTDVIIALLPCLVMSYFAFGYVPLLLTLVAVASAVLGELLFSLIFFRRIKSITDGSAIVTGILLAFTVGAFTPLYVVAFGGATAVIFGKLIWGGLGRNMFNPALVGREFMTIFFPAVMTSGSIWYSKASVNLTHINVFDNALLSELLFRSSGAVGEYSILFLTLGGLYLLLRRRISWHIPFSLLVVFVAFLFAFSGSDISFSLGGLLLGTIFMATDMPSSPSTKWGKCFYGAMIGLVVILFIVNGVRYEYMSYSILLMNAFAKYINWTFRPHTWGKSVGFLPRLWQAALLVVGILITTFAVVYLHQIGGIQYLLYVYILFSIGYFVAVRMKREEVMQRQRI